MRSKLIAYIGLLLAIPFGLVVAVRSQTPMAGNPAVAAAQDWTVLFPEDESRQLVIDRCYGCHDLGRLAKIRSDRDHWVDIIATMIVEGADIKHEELVSIANYLSAHFGPDKPRLVLPININKVGADIIRLLIPIAEQATSIVKARETNGEFDSLEELLKVDGISREKLEKVGPFISLK